jgi:hypothetical protein
MAPASNNTADRWLSRNWHHLGVMAVYLVTGGAMYASLAAKVSNNTDRIKSLEDTKPSETKVELDEVRRRVDRHDDGFNAINAKLDRMTELLARIDQRTGGTNTRQ